MALNAKVLQLELPLVLHYSIVAVALLVEELAKRLLDFHPGSP
jgi:hypothetical protein